MRMSKLFVVEKLRYIESWCIRTNFEG